MSLKRPASPCPASPRKRAEPASGSCGDEQPCPECRGTALSVGGEKFEKRLWVLGQYTAEQSEAAALATSSEARQVEKPGTSSDARQVEKFSICLRVDRNDSKPCIQVLFVEEDHGKRRKQQNKSLGYILIEIDVGKSRSSGSLGKQDHDQGETDHIHPQLALLFRGMHVQSKLRSLGLSKVFLRVFLEICRRVKAQPRTAKMDKPLLALLLEHKFSFVPKSTKVACYVVKPEAALATLEKPGRNEENRELELLRERLNNSNTSGGTFLWSSNASQLTSTIPKSYQKTQDITLLTDYFAKDEGDAEFGPLSGEVSSPARPCGNSSSTKIHLNTVFAWPADAVEERYASVLDGGKHGDLSFSSFCPRCFERTILKSELFDENVRKKLRGQH